jgi:TPR repeat protein
MFQLGALYAAGRGVRKDPARALDWYQRSVDAGSSAACLDLGRMFASGEGVERSETTALFWYRRGAAAGDERCREALAALEGGFSGKRPAAPGGR